MIFVMHAIDVWEVDICNVHESDEDDVGDECDADKVDTDDAKGVCNVDIGDVHCAKTMREVEEMQRLYVM